jgi:hypothetical protein
MLTAIPRFYQTIAYNGAPWALAGNSAFRIWTYYYYNKANSTASKTTEAVAPSNTGFYLRKGIDPNNYSSKPYLLGYRLARDPLCRGIVEPCRSRRKQ